MKVLLIAPMSASLENGSKKDVFLKNIFHKSRLSIMVVTFLAGLLVLTNPSQALEKECRIKGTKEQLKNVFSSTFPRTVCGVIVGGSTIYTGFDYGRDIQSFKLKDGELNEIGVVKSNDIDCTSIGPSDGYPILFDNTKQLYDAVGLVFDDLPEANKYRNSLYECLYIGDGSPGVWLSKQFVNRYKSRNISLDNVCTVLKSGEVRFDPESGKRLPTYMIKGSGRGEEYTLIVPDCFSKGKFSRAGSSGAVISPIGCSVKYHPYSGRKLSDQEIAIFTRRAEIAIDGGAGEVKEDSTNLLSSSARKGSSINIESLRNMLK